MRNPNRASANKPKSSPKSEDINKAKEKQAIQQAFVPE